MRNLRSVSVSVLSATLFGLLSIGVFAQAPAKMPDSIEALQKRINDLINHPRYAAAFWGVKIVSLDSGKTLFEHNAEKLFSPASNSKLYTMAFALDRLGADYRIKTSLYAQSRPDEHGTLTGDLIVYGRGDPTISGEYNGGDVLKALEPLAAALTNAGVKQINGDLVADDSYFHGPPFGSGWDWSDLENEYGAEISALTINSNTVQLLVKPGESIGAPAVLTFSPATSYIAISNRTETATKAAKRNIHLYRPVAENVVYVSGQIALDDPGSSEDVTMHNPAGLFVELFSEALAKRGITVSGRPRTLNWKDPQHDWSQWIEIGAIQSRPFRDIIRSVQKPSQNLYTDLMLEHIGAGLLSDRATNPDLTAEEMGVRELNKFLAKAGVKKGDTILEEGSGLSRDNLTTPNATVALLTFMSHHKDFEIYLNALPVAGVDGTLRRRMKDTVAAGNVRAKTGTLHWANSMSGYVTTAAGERLVFSIMLNRFQSAARDHSKTADLDAIAEMLAAFTVRMVR